MKKEEPCARGAGLFATQDQYRGVPGHEIIDRIRYLALSGLSAHRLAELKSIHAKVLFLQVSSILLDSLVLNISRSIYQLFFLLRSTIISERYNLRQNQLRFSFVARKFKEVIKSFQSFFTRSCQPKPL